MTFLITCRTAGHGRRSSSPTAANAPAVPVRVFGPELAGYLFFRENVNGWQTEWWVHRDGCRRWFLAERRTGTNEVRRTFWPREADAATAASEATPASEATQA